MKTSSDTPIGDSLILSAGIILFLIAFAQISILPDVFDSSWGTLAVAFGIGLSGLTVFATSILIIVEGLYEIGFGRIHMFLLRVAAIAPVLGVVFGLVYSSLAYWIIGLVVGLLLSIVTVTVYAAREALNENIRG